MAALAVAGIPKVVGASQAAKCDAAKLKVAGKQAGAILNAYARNLVKPNNGKLTATLQKAEGALTVAFSKADDSGQCTRVDDAPQVLVAIDTIAALLRYPTSMVYQDDRIEPVAGFPAVLSGSLIVDRDTGALAGQVTVRFEGGRIALVSGTPTGIRMQVGGVSVELHDGESTAIVNGVATDIGALIERMLADFQQSADPAEWSPETQAVMAIAMLTSTPAWQANADAGGAVSNGLLRGSRATSAAQPSAQCQARSLGGAWFGKVIGGAACTLGVPLVCGGGAWLCHLASVPVCEALKSADAYAVKEYMLSTCSGSQQCVPGDARPCYSSGLDSTTRNRGACHDGLDPCRDDGSGYAGVCLGEQGPATEICGNGADDNCNGLPDVLDPACGGSGVVGIRQLTTGGAGATNQLLMTADARMVVFDAPGGVFSIRTDGSGFLQYPDRQNIFPPGCSNTGCNYCENGATGPFTVDGSGSLVAYQAFLNSCGSGASTILMPQGTSDVIAPFGGATQHPTISLDGSRVAYQKTYFQCWGCPVASEVWVSDPSGLVFSTRVLSTSAGAREPVLSGDGQRIVYRAGSGSALKIVDVAGGEATARDVMPPNAYAGRFSVSSDGTLIVFDSAEDLVPGENPGHASQIFLWEDGTGIRQLTHSAGGADAPALSGDGRRVAFRFAGDLYTYDIASGTSTLVVDVPSGRSVYPPVLDRTGTMMAFASDANLTGENESGFVEIFAAQVP